MKGCSNAAPRLRICVVEKIFVPCHMLLPPRLVLALAAGLIGGYVGKSFAHGPFGGGFGGPMAMGAMADPAKVAIRICN